MSKKPDQMFSSQAGFSLLEMTIVLGILGILSTFALPKISAYRHHRAFCVTRDHQDLIVKGLESYLIHHGYLPRPDSFSDTGSERSSQHNLSDLNDKSKNVMGAVPYYDLGLPESVAKDGYGNLMTYVVANDACIMQDHQKSEALPFCRPYTEQNNNLIEILDGKNNNVLSNYILPEHRKMIKNIAKNELRDGSTHHHEDTSYNDVAENNIAFTIISHGPEGPHRAGSPEEEDNNQAHFDQYKIKLLIRPYSVNPTKLFRHQIVWGTQQEFAGFCKSQKIIRSFDRFHQTFLELKDFADTMEKSSNIYKELKALISGKGGQPLDQKESSSLIKIKKSKDSDDQLGQETTPSGSQEKSDLPKIEAPSVPNYTPAPADHSKGVPLQKQTKQNPHDHDLSDPHFPEDINFN